MMVLPVSVNNFNGIRIFSDDYRNIGTETFQRRIWDQGDLSEGTILLIRE